MPKSRVRNKRAYTPPPDKMAPAKARPAGPSHPLYVAVMLGMMLLGLSWLVVNYLAGDKIGLFRDLGAYNFLIGFALMIVGLFMTMKWH
ncbi:MAG: cell division protein CrgA [Pseudonocardiaceae bacterium]|nr:cell division protein CrgA [Pseudonocardiaceae bacterium]